MKKILKFGFLAILVILVGYTFFFLWSKSRPVEEVYSTVYPKIESIKKSTIVTGNISPRDEILIKPQISGIIAEVYKEAGQIITQGDIIAKVKVIPDVGSLNNMESQVRSAEINFNQAELVFNRDKKLLDKGIITREEFEKSETSYSMAKENKESAMDALQILKEGLSKRTAQYSSTLIRSTISGLVLDIPVKVGNSVIQSNSFNDGTTIATVANMNDMIFIGNVDESEVGRLHEGMAVALTIGALPDITLDAKLEYISPKGEKTTAGANQFEIKAAAQMKEGVFIRAGYSANGEIILAKADNVLTIPEYVIEFKNDSSFVNILKTDKPKQVFERRYVELGLSNGVDIEVKSGVDADDELKGSLLDPNMKAANGGSGSGGRGRGRGRR